MKTLIHFLIAMLFVGSTAHAQLLDSAVLDELKFRNIGPAFTSGRIADIAIDSKNQNIMYAAVGSGGVWKTTSTNVDTAEKIRQSILKQSRKLNSAAEMS